MIKFLDVKNPGERVRSVREQRGWTAARLAKESGVDSGRISRLENDVRLPEAPALLRVARTLGLSLEWILTGAGPQAERGATDPRGLAIEIAESGGVIANAVRIVAAREVRPDERDLPALYWVDEMRAEEVRQRTRMRTRGTLPRFGRR